MKSRKFRKLFSSFLVFTLVLSMLFPMYGAANENVEAKKQINDTEAQMKRYIAEQKALLNKGPVLHQDLQDLTGNEEVSVIVQFSEMPVALVKGDYKLAGKTFTAAAEKNVQQKVLAQQQTFERQLLSKGLDAKLGFNYTYAFNGMALTLKANQVKELLTLEGVTLVEPDLEVHALNDEKSVEDTFYPAMNSSAPHLGVPALWDLGVEGQNVKVAVLDTGIDYNHPEFEGVYKGGYNFVTHGTTYARARANDDPYETSPLDRPASQPEVNSSGRTFYTNHGTHVAGTIAAQGNNPYGIKGLAPKIELYAYRVLGAYGSGATSGIIAGIDKAAAEKMDVMNLSLGGSSTSSTASDSIAINNAVLAGTVSVVATGNSGPNRGTIGNPSTAAFSIAVGNTTVPADSYSSNVNVTVEGSDPTTYSMNLMGWKFGSNPGAVLNGEYDLVAVPNWGVVADYNGLDVNGKVVLVSRGGSVPFVDKIAAAKGAGAVGILIHNNGTGGNGPAGIALGDSFAFIPAYDMSTTDGTALRAELQTKTAKVTFTNFNKTLTGGDDVNSSSSRGPTTPNFDIKPDVVAPGTNIMSSIPAYAKDYPGANYSEAYDRFTGTSMATPHVAGIAALLKSMHPEWSPVDIKVAISTTAKQLDVTKYDVFSQGPGLVQPYLAATSKALAYSKDRVTFSNNTYDNVKGTITFGNVPTGSASTITKDVVVKNLSGNPSDYTVSVQVTKSATGSLAAANVTVDKTNFTLTDEETLKVRLNVPAGTGATGNELLGYVHITDGTTKLILPFAASFGPPTGMKSFSIDSKHISPNADGKLDSTTVRYEFYNSQARTYLELWDAQNQTGGYYEDGYLGWLVNSASTSTGAKSVAFDGSVTYWGGTKQPVPDGVYTLDLTTLNSAQTAVVTANWIGPVFVKRTAPTIVAADAAVQGSAATYSGSLTDSYVNWKSVVEEVFGQSYDVNDYLNARYELTNTAGELVDSKAITLAQDGTFNIALSGLTTGDNTLKILVDDVAQNAATKEVTITSNTVTDPDPVDPDPEDPAPPVELVAGQGIVVKGSEALGNLIFSLHSVGGEEVWYDYTTDENGVFTHDLADGTYKVVGIWDSPVWYQLNRTFTIEDGLVNGKPLVINALNPQLPDGNVKGTLKEGTSALANTVFSLRSEDGSNWYDARTDARGKFVFSLPDGNYVVEGIWNASKGKWYQLNQQFTVEAGNLVGATELLIDVKSVTPNYNVTGTLTKGGAALSHVIFSLHTTTGAEVWYDTQTDENGAFGFNLPDGSYMIQGIWLDSEGKWYPLQQEFTVSGSHVLTIELP